MDAIMFAVTFSVGVLAIVGINIILRNNKLKKTEGIILLGRVVSRDEMTGTPNRYILEVEYVINDDAHRKRVVTTDQNIMKYKVDESVPLIYVEKNRKVYWAEDKSKEYVAMIVCLTVFAIYAFMVATVALLSLMGQI